MCLRVVSFRHDLIHFLQQNMFSHIMKYATYEGNTEGRHVHFKTPLQTSIFGSNSSKQGVTQRWSKPGDCLRTNFANSKYGRLILVIFSTASTCDLNIYRGLIHNTVLICRCFGIFLVRNLVICGRITRSFSPILLKSFYLR